MQLANIIKLCHKIHKLKLIVSVSQHPSIQCPSIQHSSPSTLRKALYIQCSSTQRLHPPPSTHIFIKASTRRSFPVKVLPPSHI